MPGVSELTRFWEAQASQNNTNNSTVDNSPTDTHTEVEQKNSSTMSNRSQEGEPHEELEEEPSVEHVNRVGDVVEYAYRAFCRYHLPACGCESKQDFALHSSSIDSANAVLNMPEFLDKIYAVLSVLILEQFPTSGEIDDMRAHCDREILPRISIQVAVLHHEFLNKNTATTVYMGNVFVDGELVCQHTSY